ncbi:hypothetical protein GpartN1_g3915.t1 [Galdieria partita]|uniref:BAR domain-containing protein n=1 Tax=Galdieria partita TaxID=83374 RepID=A0A9C7PXS4_9RHOD|nr:hypothetical protein GpartN1_g3915.t1 [Galdieria partita]
MAKEAFFTFAKLGLQLREEFGLEDVYENDEELRLQLVSVKGLKKSSELIKTRFTRYANASNAMVVAGRAATSSLGDIARLARPRNQGIFGPKSSADDDNSMDTSLVAVTNSTNDSGLCSKELRQLLFSVSRAERDVHEALSAFSRAIDVTIVKPRKDFLETYSTEFRARKNAFKEAKRNFKAHARAQQRGQDSEVIGVNGIERFELAEARSAYENAEVELARYAAKLEEENDRILLRNVAGFVVQHHAALMRCLVALEKVLPLCYQYASENIHRFYHRASQGSSLDTYFVSEGARSQQMDALISAPNSGALTFIRSNSGLSGHRLKQSLKGGTNSDEVSSFDVEQRIELMRNLISRLVLTIWKLVAKCARESNRKSMGIYYPHSDSLKGKSFERSTQSSSDTVPSLDDFQRIIGSQRLIIHRLISSRWLTAARFAQTQRAVVSFTSLPWRRRSFRLAARLAVALNKIKRRGRFRSEGLEGQPEENNMDEEGKLEQEEVFLREQNRRIEAETELRRMKYSVVGIIRQHSYFETEFSTRSDNQSLGWLGGWDTPELLFMSKERKVFIRETDTKKVMDDVTSVAPGQCDGYYSYEYDTVLDMDSSQEQTLRSVAELLVAALERKSGTLLIFGSSAEAEMHTAIGLRDDPGIFLLAVQKILRVLSPDQSLFVSFETYDHEGNNRTNLLSNYKSPHNSAQGEFARMSLDSSQHLSSKRQEGKKVEKGVENDGEYLADFGQYWKSASQQQSISFIHVGHRRECERLLSHAMREYSFITREREGTSHLLISLKIVNRDRVGSVSQIEGLVNIAVIFCNAFSLDKNFYALRNPSKVSLCESIIQIRQLLAHHEEVRLTSSVYYPEILRTLVERGAFMRNGRTKLAVLGCIDQRNDVETNANLLEFISNWRSISLADFDNSSHLLSLLFDNCEDENISQARRRLRTPLRTSRSDNSDFEESAKTAAWPSSLTRHVSTTSSLDRRNSQRTFPATESSLSGSREPRTALKTRRPFRTSEAFEWNNAAHSEIERKDDMYESNTYQYLL